MRTDLSPQQKAANTRKFKALVKELAEKQELYRTNPQALAARLAEDIRKDQHKNEYPADYDNGGLHYYQNDWGQFKIDPKRIESPLENNPYWVPISCPTTGCVAGLAAVLTGHKMLISSDWQEEYEPGDVINSSGCIDPQGRSLPIVQAGQEVLGLDERQARWLFEAHQSVNAVLWALDQLAETGNFDPDMYEVAA